MAPSSIRTRQELSNPQRLRLHPREPTLGPSREAQRLDRRACPRNTSVQCRERPGCCTSLPKSGGWIAVGTDCGPSETDWRSSWHCGGRPHSEIGGPYHGTTTGPCSGESHITFSARFEHAGCECVARETDPQSTVLSIDGVSAFDLISRSAMMQRLREVNEEALPFVRPFYGQPSTYLWEDDDNVVHSIPQGEGREQGGPLMPLLPSLGQILGVHHDESDAMAKHTATLPLSM